MMQPSSARSMGPSKSPADGGSALQPASLSQEAARSSASHGLEASAPAGNQSHAGIRVLVNEPVVQRFLEHVQPWRTFFVITEPSRMGPNVLVRAQANLYHFLGNYISIFGGLLVAGILEDLNLLIAVLVVAACWFIYFKKNLGDPAWRPVVLGTEIAPEHRWAVLHVGSVVVLLFASFFLLLLLSGLTCALALAHAVLHPGAEAVADDQLFLNGKTARAEGQTTDLEAASSPNAPQAAVVGVAAKTPSDDEGAAKSSPAAGMPSFARTDVVMGVPVFQPPSFRGPSQSEAASCSA